MDRGGFHVLYFHGDARDDATGTIGNDAGQAGRDLRVGRGNRDRGKKHHGNQDRKPAERSRSARRERTRHKSRRRLRIHQSPGKMRSAARCWATPVRARHAWMNLPLHMVSTVISKRLDTDADSWTVLYEFLRVATHFDCAGLWSSDFA